MVVGMEYGEGGKEVNGGDGGKFYGAASKWGSEANMGTLNYHYWTKENVFKYFWNITII